MDEPHACRTCGRVCGFPGSTHEPLAECDIIGTGRSFSVSRMDTRNNKGDESLSYSQVSISLVFSQPERSAVDFHLHEPFHSRLVLELLHFLGVFAAQFLDFPVICLDAVEDGLGTQVILAQGASVCAH